MKIRLDIDATPQELRSFFGLPDVEALQQELLGQIRDKLQAGVEGFDPLTLMQPLLPEHLRSLESLQKAFWQAFAAQEGDHKGAK